MNRSILITLATALALSVPVQAKPAFLKKAQELKIADVKNCASCHMGAPKKGGNMTEMGKWLIAQKTPRKAAEVDVAWLKEYTAKK